MKTRVAVADVAVCVWRVFGAWVFSACVGKRRENSKAITFCCLFVNCLRSVKENVLIGGFEFAFIFYFFLWLRCRWPWLLSATVAAAPRAAAAAVVVVEACV